MHATPSLLGLPHRALLRRFEPAPRELGGLVQQRPQPRQPRPLQHHRPHLLPSMALAGLRPKSTLRLCVVGAYKRIRLASLCARSCGG